DDTGAIWMRSALSGGSNSLTLAGTNSSVTFGDILGAMTGTTGGVTVDGPTVNFAGGGSDYVGGTTVVSGTGIFGGSSTSATTWAASTARSIGNVTVPTSPNGFYYEVTTAGTSGTSQPNFAAATTLGSTLSDGTIVYTVRATPNGGFGTGNVTFLGGSTLQAN